MLQNVTVVIAGTDRTGDVVPVTLRVQDVLGHRLNRCSFHLRRTEPDLWGDVRVLVQGQAVFTGYVVQVRKSAKLGSVWQVEALDEGLMLDRRVVTATFENMYDGEIVRALIADSGLSLDTTGVQNVKMITRIRFNRRTLRDAIQRLARLSGAVWYVHDGALRYWDGKGEPAPFGISEAPDDVHTFPAQRMTINRDAAGVVNMVEVVGATYLSEPTTMYLQGTGEDKRVNLFFRAHPPPGETAIQVWRNDGDDVNPVWTPMVVKAGYVDTLSGPDEVLHFYQEKVLEQQAPWPNLGKAVKVFARYEVPLRVRVRSDSSIAHYGRKLQTVLVDTSLVSKEEARLAGKRLLAENAFARVALTFRTVRAGLRAGQVVSVNYPSLGVQGEYLVQRVVMTVGARGYAVWDVEAGVYDPDLIDIVLTLLRDDEPDWNDEEVLDELLEESERLQLAESATLVPSQHPYVFDTARFDFARFG